MTKTEDRKIYEPETYGETPLPEAVIWEEIVDKPTSLSELSSTDGAALAAATVAITGLGDLAYEDLVGTLQIAAGAVTNAKIAVDAIQGAVIAAGAITTTKISDSAIETGKLAANAVTAAKIAAGTITATQIAAGTITADRIMSGTITAAQIAAGSITVDRLTAGSLVGFTISTGTSGQRVVLTTTLAQFYNSSGVEIVDLYADLNDYLIKGMQSSSSIYLDTGSSGTVAFLQNGALRIVFSPASGYFSPVNSGTIDLGSAGAEWADLHHVGFHRYQGVYAPIVYWMQVQSGGIVYGNDSGWTVSTLSTGKYRVYHNFSTLEYGANATAIRASGAGAYSAKIEAVNSNYVDVTIFNDSGTAVDSDFFLTLMKSPT